MEDERDELDVPAEYPIIEFGYGNHDFDDFLWDDGEDEEAPAKKPLSHLGLSRVGGGVVDLPPGVDFPANHTFVAQLDMAVFSQHDPLDLLPKRGQIYVFISDEDGPGIVFYSDVENNQLVRTGRWCSGWFCQGMDIKNIRSSTETLESRYRLEEDGTREWDYFAGGRRSKIFGLFTSCHWDEDYVLQLVREEEVVLLQIGEDYTGEGVCTVFMSLEDLKKRDFSRVIVCWNQS